MPFATHRGEQIPCEVGGSGPALILQHGLLGHAASWAQHGYVEAFADGYLVVSVDPLGHGESDGHSFDDMQQQIAPSTCVPSVPILTILKLALAWLASQPAVASVSAGATKPAQLRSNAAATLCWQLDRDRMAEVDRILASIC